MSIIFMVNKAKLNKEKTKYRYLPLQKSYFRK